MSAEKIKLDGYDIRIVINGLARYRETVPSEDLDVIDPMLLRLIKVSKTLKKPGKRTKLFFSPEEKRLTRFYLNELRNQFIQDNISLDATNSMRVTARSKSLLAKSQVILGWITFVPLKKIQNKLVRREDLQP